MMEYIRYHQFKLFERFTDFTERYTPTMRDERGRTFYDITVYRSKFYIGPSYILDEEGLIDGFLIKTHVSRTIGNRFRLPETHTTLSCEYFNLTFSVSLPNGVDVENAKGNFVRGIRFFLKKYDKKYAANKSLDRLFRWLNQ